MQQNTVYKLIIYSLTQIEALRVKKTFLRSTLIVGRSFFIAQITHLKVILKLKMSVMTNELKVLFYLKKNQEKNNGLCPVMGRIHVGKTMAQFS